MVLFPESELVPWLINVLVMSLACAAWKLRAGRMTRGATGPYYVTRRQMSEKRECN
jgi:hypothetical protein